MLLTCRWLLRQAIHLFVSTHVANSGVDAIAAAIGEDQAGAGTGNGLTISTSWPTCAVAWMMTSTPTGRDQVGGK